MKKRPAVTVALVALLLTGCSSEPTAPVETEPPADNTAACESFWDVTVDLASALTGEENLKVSTEGMEARFDEAYLSAHGEVAARIQRAMDNFPDAGLHMLYISPDQFMDDMEAVVRACRADGVPLEQAEGVAPAS